MMNITKIQSKQIQAKVEAILKNRHPLHNDRLWLVGFLNFVGYTPDQIMEIISQGNQWLDYDKQTTKHYIESTVYRSRRKVSFAKEDGAVEVAHRASSPPPKAFGHEMKSNLSLGNDIYVRCGYSECKEYGKCHHSHIHFIESERIGNSYFSWCGVCPIQEVRCLPIDKGEICYERNY